MHVRHLAKPIRTKALLVISGLITMLLAAGTTAALVNTGPNQPDSEPLRPGQTAARSDPPKTGEVARTSSPEAFAVSVARTLFAWDTTAATPLDGYTNRILEVADPTGEETPGLVTDLTTYLPSAESWADLKTYRTRQWLDINSYVIPSGWRDAEFNGETIDLPAGTTAYTITGLRRRSGIWQGKQAQTVDRVSFTEFIVCKPTYDTCRLLRLSQLNDPLH